MKKGKTNVQVIGLKFCNPILHLLEKLHKERKAPNRKLHYDQLTVLLLMAYFDSAHGTLREIVAMSKLKKVQKALGVSATSLGSVSEASHVFDPELLRQIFLQTSALAFAADGLPRPPGVSPKLALKAVDGSLWTALPRMYKALAREGPRPGRKPGFLLQVHYDLCSGVPTGAQVADAFASEKELLLKSIAKDTCYIVDRGYFSYSLLQSIVDEGSSFVIRAKDYAVCRVRSENPLSDAARKAGVYSDQVVDVGSAPHAQKLKQPLRMIRARTQLPPQHNLIPGGRKQAASEEGIVELILLTDRMDWDADLLMYLYSKRWQIELFFRWFKHVLGCRHLIFESENGFELQTYTALIGALLIVIYLGRKPNMAAMRAIRFYLNGWASYKEFRAMIDKVPAAKP